MTFASAISSLRNGRAAYSPAMRGYICRRDHDVSGNPALASAYDIVFVENADIDPYSGESSTDGTEYAFTREESVSGQVTWYNPNLGVEGNGQVAKPFVLDCVMFAAMLASDWEVTDTETAAARRTALNSESRW